MRRRDFLAAGIVLAANSCIPTSPVAEGYGRVAEPQSDPADAESPRQDGERELNEPATSTTGEGGDAGEDAVPADANTEPSDDGAALREQAFPPAGALWYASHELRTAEQEWEAAGGGFPHSGTGRHELSSYSARSGTHSLKMTINTSDGDSHGARAHRYGPEIQDYSQFFVSCWYFIPQHVTVNRWWQIGQLKTRLVRPNGSVLNDPIWETRIGNRSGTGNMYLMLRNKREYFGGLNTTLEQSKVDVPLGKWFNVEWFVVKSTGAEANGRVRIWQDGIELWDARNVRTRHDRGDNRWGATNYGKSLKPSTVSAYYDNVVISKQRVWTTT